MTKGFKDGDKKFHPTEPKKKRVLGKSESSDPSDTHSSALDAFAESRKEEFEKRKQVMNDRGHVWNRFWEDKMVRKEFFSIEHTGVSSGDKKRFLTWNEVEEIYNELQRESLDDAVNFMKKIKVEMTYPDELTLEDFDSVPWDKTKQFGLEDDADPKKVLAYANKIGGQVYTQVSAGDDRMYSKGLRSVNNTGMYEVVLLGDNHVDNS